MKITFYVNNQILQRTDANVIVANSTDYLEVEATFSSDWNGLEKTIQFVNGEIVYTFLMVQDSSVYKVTADKHLNLGVGTWKVSVKGIADDTRIVTNAANLSVHASGWAGDAEPPQDVYEQLLVVLQSLHTEAASTAVVRSAVEEFIDDNLLTILMGNFYTKAQVDALIPTKTSDLTNDSGFITNAVNNLTNYYLKSETYTKAEVQALIASDIAAAIDRELDTKGEAADAEVVGSKFNSIRDALYTGQLKKYQYWTKGGLSGSEGSTIVVDGTDATKQYVIDSLEHTILISIASGYTYYWYALDNSNVIVLAR